MSKCPAARPPALFSLAAAMYSTAFHCHLVGVVGWGPRQVAGSLIKWLRDSLGIISKASEVNKLANKVKDNGKVRGTAVRTSRMRGARW